MRAVVERVRRAEVRVGGRVAGRIGSGLLVMVAIGSGDDHDAAYALAKKIVSLRLFDNDEGRMDRSILEAGGDVLCVSEFTLYGDCRRGRRPSYSVAAVPDASRPLYEAFVESLRGLIEPAGGKVETGEFRAMMDVESVNDGPVTLLVDSEKAF